MVDEVKLAPGINTSTATPVTADHAKPVLSDEVPTSDGMTVTNKLSTYIYLTLNEDIETEDLSHVLAIKDSLAAQQYQVNHEALARKLHETMLVKLMGS